MRMMRTKRAARIVRITRMRRSAASGKKQYCCCTYNKQRVIVAVQRYLRRERCVLPLVFREVLQHGALHLNGGRRQLFLSGPAPGHRCGPRRSKPAIRVVGYLEFPFLICSWSHLKTHRICPAAPGVCTQTCMYVCMYAFMHVCMYHMCVHLPTSEESCMCV